MNIKALLARAWDYFKQDPCSFCGFPTGTTKECPECAQFRADRQAP